MAALHTIILLAAVVVGGAIVAGIMQLISTAIFKQQL